MQNKFLLSVVYELLWFAIAAVAAYLMVLPVKNEISLPFYQYLLASLFLVFTYFRFITFMMRSVLLESVWIKLALFVINFPLFFFVMDQYYTYGKVFDEYIYTLPANLTQFIKAGTELEDLMYIKRLVTFSGFAALTMIVLFQVRMVHAIFKLRQLDRYLWKTKA